MASGEIYNENKTFTVIHAGSSAFCEVVVILQAPFTLLVQVNTMRLYFSRLVCVVTLYRYRVQKVQLVLNIDNGFLETYLKLC